MINIHFIFIFRYIILLKIILNINILYLDLNVGNNVLIEGKLSERVGKKVPTYGTLVVENIKNGLYYLNIENLKEGDTIYLQFIFEGIFDKYEHKRLDIRFLFTDENYNKMFDKFDYSRETYDIIEEDVTIIYYISEDIEKKQNIVFSTLHISWT